MTRIGGPPLRIHHLSPATLEALEASGITMDELEELAGPDGLVEPRRLADRGAGVDAVLQAEAARARQEAHARGIIHLGMREASSREVAALRRENPAREGGVRAIRPGDPGALAGEDGVRRFAGRLLAGRHAEALAELFLSLPVDARDELAGLAVALADTGHGTLRANRLVLSGHSDGASVRGDDVSDDASSRIPLAAVVELAHLFPAGSARIEHVAISACFCMGPRTAEELRTAFPALKSVWGYRGLSPSAEHGAPRALVRWERMTDDEDASRVDGDGGGAAVTWNVADGFHGYVGPLAVYEAQLDDARWVWDEYQGGLRPASAAPRDAALRDYYGRLQSLIAHPQLDPARRAALQAHRDEVLWLRHPEWKP